MECSHADDDDDSAVDDNDNGGSKEKNCMLENAAGDLD